MHWLFSALVITWTEKTSSGRHLSLFCLVLPGSFLNMFWKPFYRPTLYMKPKAKTLFYNYTSWITQKFFQKRVWQRWVILVCFNLEASFSILPRVLDVQLHCESSQVRGDGLWPVQEVLSTVAKLPTTRAPVEGDDNFDDGQHNFQIEQLLVILCLHWMPTGYTTRRPNTYQTN